MKSFKLKSNGSFGMLEDMMPHNQHPNQQEGLDLYVRVLNLVSGEDCHKKLYEGRGGRLYFKHKGYSNMYMDSFDQEVTYVPYQIIYEEEK
jgi:hypothetical protein